MEIVVKSIETHETLLRGTWDHPVDPNFFLSGFVWEGDTEIFVDGEKWTEWQAGRHLPDGTALGDFPVSENQTLLVVSNDYLTSKRQLVQISLTGGIITEVRTLVEQTGPTPDGIQELDSRALVVGGRF